LDKDPDKIFALNTVLVMFYIDLNNTLDHQVLMPHQLEMPSKG
jgi:hypothetical protein